MSPINQLLNKLLIMTTNTGRVKEEHLYLSSRRRIALLQSHREPLKECFIENIGANETTIIRSFTFGVSSSNDIETLLGLTYLPIFFRNTPLPSRMDWRQRILFEARSISSSSRIAPLWSASMTGPLCHTVAPSTRRKSHQ